MEEKYNLVSLSVFDPTRSIFKQPQNTKAQCTAVHCCLEDCSLRDAGSCMFIAILGGTRCPYGKISRETGPTKRARSFRKWINEKEERAKRVGSLSHPAKKMEFVGEYVYLPYSHMSMSDNSHFINPSKAFSSGDCLIPKENWTVKTVLSLIDFKPQALFGGEIKCYQKDQVPLFLLHLREEDPDMWAQLIKERPALDTTPDHFGRKAILKTLNSPIEWTTRHENYPVTWKWDGTHLKTTSKNAYSNTWGDMKLGSFELIATPDENAEVVVQDNSWVNAQTKFTT